MGTKYGENESLHPQLCCSSVQGFLIKTLQTSPSPSKPRFMSNCCNCGNQHFIEQIHLSNTFRQMGFFVRLGVKCQFEGFWRLFGFIFERINSLMKLIFCPSGSRGAFCELRASDRRMIDFFSKLGSFKHMSGVDLPQDVLVLAAGLWTLRHPVIRVWRDPDGFKMIIFWKICLINEFVWHIHVEFTETPTVYWSWSTQNILIFSNI